MVPIRQGDGTGLTPNGFAEVRKGDGTVLSSGGAIPDSGDLQAHYDASDKTDVSSTFPAEIGPDLSAVGSPSILNNEKNGLNVAAYDGSDDGHNATFSSAQAQPNHIFIVFQYRTIIQDDNTFALSSTSSTNEHLFFVRQSDDWAIFAGSEIRGGADDLNWHIASLRFNETQSNARLDGTEIISGGIGSQTFPGIGLGYRAGPGDDFADVKIGEVLVYQNDKESSVSEIESYLNDKWAVF
jgi:hypothetical protein